jgi:uncharacterized protein YbaA (DUF1428 family)
MRYVEGYVLPSRKKPGGLPPHGQEGGKNLTEHGALEYRECAGDDLKVKFGVPFTRSAKAKPGETVVFSWIAFKSRAHRDRVNAKVMKALVSRRCVIRKPCPSISSAWSTADSRSWSTPSPGLLRHRAQYVC